MEIILNSTQYRFENVTSMQNENAINRNLGSQSQINTNEQNVIKDSFAQSLDLANRKIIETLIKPLLENVISETSSKTSYNLWMDFATEQITKLFAVEISKEIMNKNLTMRK